MEPLDNEIPIGSLVTVKSGNGDVLGVIVDTHRIRAWISEPETNTRYKYIYKVCSVDSDHIRYCYSYEMVIIST